MTIRTLHLLHIEDDRIQQELVAHHLAALSEYQIDIRTAASEDAAIDLFSRVSFDMVILDYHLAQGDGLNCLRRIRKIDSIVPIIAVSGVATEEIAALLIEAGADDYLNKQTMDERTLGQSARNVLTRAHAFQSRFAAMHGRVGSSSNAT
jgi:DNA-binding response OmpR family regulator